MDILNLPGLSGLPGLLFTLVAIVIWSFYIQRSAKNKAQQLANDAYDRALKASQARISLLEDHIEYLEKALEQIGIKVMIDGKIIHIKKE